MPSIPRTPSTVSLIIPVYNGGDSFRACLQSIAQAVPQPTELIVVADGDSDGSREVARAFGAHVIALPFCGGPARARNVGARAAHGDILFFVDADVTIPPDALAQIVHVFRTEPSTVALFGSYDDQPAATNFLSQYKNLFHHYVHQTSSDEASTFWGACGAIHRDVFLSMGGFDERYRFPSIEDIELGYRLKRAGHRIRLYKPLQVKHLKCWRTKSLLKADIYLRALPWTDLIWREGSMRSDLNLGFSSRVSVICVYALVGVVIGTVWWPRLLVVAGVVVGILLASNASAYRFFLQKRGVWFTLCVLPWHWFYYGYSGFAFLLGSLRHLLQRYERNQQRTTAVSQ